MQPRDLAAVRTPSMPALSPDGSTACYVVTRVDLDDDAYRSQLWVVPTDGAAPPRQLTRGLRDVAPRFSPDGRWIAFLRAGDGTPPQLHVLPADGGEAREVVAHPLGVAGFSWAPDSRRIAYLARVPEEGRYGTVEGTPPGKEPARRITTRRYRLDGVGYTIDRRPHVFAVDALDEDAVPVRVTRGDADHGAPAWSPDGTRLAFTSARHEGRDTDLAADVFVIDAPTVEALAEAAAARRAEDDDASSSAAEGAAGRAAETADPGPGGAADAADAAPSPAVRAGTVLARGADPEPFDDARRLTATSTTAADPVWTADGDALVFPGHGAPLDIVGRTTGLVRVPADGSAAPERLTDVETEEVTDPFGAGPVHVAIDDGEILTTRLHRGEVQLVAYPLAGGDPRPLVDGPRQVRGFDRSGGVTVAVVATGTSAGELVRVDADGAHALTDHGAALADVALRPLEELTATAPDGYPVHGWVVVPDGDGPHPVLLSIHGGPYTQYGHALFDEAQVYAAAGYAVVLGNPRGSQGYGQAHGRAVVHAMGTVDADDLLALLDAAVARPDVDGTRAGIMGGSYGGFMTTLLAATTDRFAGAITERALNAWDSFRGSSDIGAFFVDLYAGTDPDRIREQDPLAKADGITCPTLVIHSEEDHRCPLEQAQRLFELLQRNGVESALLLFPGEGHELSRSGLPSHRIQRFEAILDWWDRYL
jgi:dipeptidyl aminopeptidase/acylaminoacyl peptidase